LPSGRSHGTLPSLRTCRQPHACTSQARLLSGCSCGVKVHMGHADQCSACACMVCCRQQPHAHTASQVCRKIGEGAHACLLQGMR
jgi:hypothetical protein